VVIDTHTHLLPERLARAIRRFFEEHLGANAFTYPLEPEGARVHLAAAGVRRCWTLPYAHKPGMASGLNRWMAETFSKDALFIPGATLHPEDDVPRVLDEALGELGLRVVKLHCSVGAYSPEDPRLEPLWRRVSDGGQPVVVHAGKAVDGTTAEDEVESIGRVAEKWPDARIVIAHCGAPAVRTALDVLRRTRSACADLTPVITRLVPLQAEDIAGLERRLLFGSDMPNTLVTLEDAIAHVKGWGLPPEHEAAILGGNAARLVP